MATAVGFPESDLTKENPLGLWQLGSATRCSRCEGLMVIDQCFDSMARRCVQCGEVIDPVILQNRQRHVPVEGGARHNSGGISRSKEGM